MEENQMTKKLIVIGGSAGSLLAVFQIIQSLEPGFPFPLLLVLHRQSGNESMLTELLSGKSTLTAREIEEKDLIEPGYIYICPADYHVLIETDESFSLDSSEKIHHSRPSLDVVFSSAADVFKERLVGIVLSGANRDGATGLSYIKEKGGVTMVQDIQEAQVDYMPLQALEATTPDYILTAAQIGGMLNQLAR
jgi:two-component system chemotaxis response regulator CheB